MLSEQTTLYIYEGDRRKIKSHGLKHTLFFLHKPTVYGIVCQVYRVACSVTVKTLPCKALFSQLVGSQKLDCNKELDRVWLAYIRNNAKVGLLLFLVIFQIPESSGPLLTEKFHLPNRVIKFPSQASFGQLANRLFSMMRLKYDRFLCSKTWMTYHALRCLSYLMSSSKRVSHLHPTVKPH